MSVRDEELDEFERRYKQMNLPEVLRNAVNRLQQHPEESIVQLNPPSDDFYVARGSEFTAEMGIGYRQFLVDREIYVIFRKYTEHYL